MSKTPSAYSQDILIYKACMHNFRKIYKLTQVHISHLSGLFRISQTLYLGWENRLQVAHRSFMPVLFCSSKARSVISSKFLFVSSNVFPSGDISLKKLLWKVKCITRTNISFHSHFCACTQCNLQWLSYFYSWSCGFIASFIEDFTLSTACTCTSPSSIYACEHQIPLHAMSVLHTCWNRYSFIHLNRVK